MATRTARTRSGAGPGAGSGEAASASRIAGTSTSASTGGQGATGLVAAIGGAVVVVVDAVEAVRLERRRRAVGQAVEAGGIAALVALHDAVAAHRERAVGGAARLRR